MLYNMLCSMVDLEVSTSPGMVLAPIAWASSLVPTLAKPSACSVTKLPEKLPHATHAAHPRCFFNHSESLGASGFLPPGLVFISGDTDLAVLAAACQAHE